jgi:arsenate reductase
MLSDTFAGISPSSVLPFVLAELGGGLVGLVLLGLFYPSCSAAAARSVTLPHGPAGADAAVTEGA